MIISTMENRFAEVLTEFKNLSNMNNTDRADLLQRKKVKQVVTEFFTPIQRDINVELKYLKKQMEEVTTQQNDH